MVYVADSSQYTVKGSQSRNHGGTRYSLAYTPWLTQFPSLDTQDHCPGEEITYSGLRALPHQSLLIKKCPHRLLL